MPQKRKRTRGSKSGVEALENETKVLLGRRNNYACRAAEYRPSLEEFKSMSFTDYVRKILMGVPLEISPKNSSLGATVLAHPQNCLNNGKADHMSQSCQDQKKVLGKNNSKREILDFPACIPTSTSTDSYEACVKEIGYAEKAPSSLDSKNDFVINIGSSIVPDNDSSTSCREAMAQCFRMEPQPPSNPEDCNGSVVFDLEVPSVKSSALKTMQSRFMRDTSSDISSDESCETSTSMFLDPDKMLLQDGIAKVTPPEGWWDRKGIGNDLTGRGPAWLPGTKLGDLKVTNPIKQCASGIGGVYDFTMLELTEVTLSEFRKKADMYRKKQVGYAIDNDTSYPEDEMDNLARRFWRRLGPTMEASIYGADMEGSLFDGDSACGWNVDRLDSCLKLLRADIPDGDAGENFTLPGVTSAYLYVGMWASVFAAHTEDMNLLSINYLHAGAPKYWYAISPEDSPRFESLAASHFGGAASLCSEFLRHKQYLLSPNILKKAGIGYTTQVQRAGDIIITFPGSYHFGFNTGYNVAESTNFAVPEWIPMGLNAGVCLCHPHSVRIDMTNFKRLLRKYQRYCKNHPERNISYGEWAELEAIKRKTRSAKVKGNDESKGESEDDSAADESGNSCFEGFTVKIVSSPTKQKSRGGKNKKDGMLLETWRTALKVKPETFTPSTKVLCMLSCNIEDEGKAKRFFPGIIKEILEDHARVNFVGMTKKEDVWMPLDSPNLFFDGGEEDPPKEMKAGWSQRKKKKTTVSSKQRKVRKGARRSNCAAAGNTNKSKKIVRKAKQTTKGGRVSVELALKKGDISVEEALEELSKNYNGKA